MPYGSGGFRCHLPGGPADLCEVILPASEPLKVVRSICCERNLKQVCGSLDHAFSQL